MSLASLKPIVLATVLGVAFTLAGAANLPAGQGGVMRGFGTSAFSTDTPVRLTKFPTLEAIIPVPSFFDPSEQDLIFVSCQVDAQRGTGNWVKRAKGKFVTELVVLDHTSGMFEVFELDSGKFNTGSVGAALFGFDIPTSLFADGFASGDVSAWSHTRTNFKKKKGDGADMFCRITTSR